MTRAPRKAATPKPRPNRASIDVTFPGGSRWQLKTRDDGPAAKTALSMAEWLSEIADKIREVHGGHESSRIERSAEC